MGIGPFQPTLKHILSAWERSDHPNMFFTMFEEMKIDLDSVIEKLSTFLGKKLTPEQKSKIISLVNIDVFRKNHFVNKSQEINLEPKPGQEFIRKGEIGDWKNYFTPEMNREWDPWIEEDMKGSSLKMTFEN
jgi:hypothetical protein